MKKLTLAVAVMSVLGVSAAKAAVLSEGANGLLVPYATHDGNWNAANGTGMSTVVGLNSCHDGTVYWTYWDPNTKHLADDRFKITKNMTYGYVWADPSNSGTDSANEVGYLTFVLDTGGESGALDVSDVPCLAGNAFQVNLSEQDVVFQPALPLDASLGDFGICQHNSELIDNYCYDWDGIYVPNLDAMDEFSVAGLAAGADAHDIIHLRYLIDPSGLNSSTIYVWSSQDISKEDGYTVQMYNYDQDEKSVQIPMPNAELNWFDPREVKFRNPNHVDGVIEFIVPQYSEGEITDEDWGKLHKGVFSWTFVDGPTFGAVQTIINPIYIRDYWGNYGHRARVITLSEEFIDEYDGDIPWVFSPSGHIVWFECDNPEFASRDHYEYSEHWCYLNGNSTMGGF